MTDGLKYIPLMTVSEFASCVGVSEGVVIGWVKRDYIPTVKMGRHRLVNVALLSSSLNVGGSILKSGKDSMPLVSGVGSKGGSSASEEQMDLFMKLPRNEKRTLKKKHGSLMAAVASVG